MKDRILRVLAGVLLSSGASLGGANTVSTVAASSTYVWNFDRDQQGAIAEAFSGEVGQWEVVKDATAPSKDHVLAQLAKNSRSTFNVVLVRDTSFEDVDIAVSFKAIGGRIDQGGGPVWRAKDANNYYIARYNSLENNYRVYKVVGGRRTHLGSANIGASPGWHNLRVTMIGDRIQGYYDDRRYLDVRDDTFTGPGQVGLWTKADAQTHFDDFRATMGLDAKLIETASGTKASVTADGVVRIGWSRDDVEVTVDGMTFPPPAGLGSWAAFSGTERGAMVMGDTVVFGDEVNPAIDAAFAHGLEVTGLHNHFFYDEPKVYFIHIGGQGTPVELAKGVKAMWDAIKQVRAKSPNPADLFDGPIPQPGEGRINPIPIEQITGLKASENPGGVVKVSTGREASMHGATFGGSMGLTTWAAFSGTDELAAMDGDFIMSAQEVQSVLRALRKAKINIVALHNHMTGETPAYYFVHFWATGSTRELAEGFKAALDAQPGSGKHAN